MKNKVIITGYPKSGNTWLTRLIAEALDSPVIGFYNEADTLWGNCSVIAESLGYKGH